MPRTAAAPAGDRAALESLCAGGTSDRRIALRARIILLSMDGKKDSEISESLSLSKNRVGVWRRRFLASGIDGLLDLPRPGMRPSGNPAHERQALASMLEGMPPPGFRAWDGAALAKALGVSKHKAWRLLRRHGISLRRQRTWTLRIASTATPRAASLVGLYVGSRIRALVMATSNRLATRPPENDRDDLLTSSGALARAARGAGTGWPGLTAALRLAGAQTAAGHGPGGWKTLGLPAFLDKVRSRHPDALAIHVCAYGEPLESGLAGWVGKSPGAAAHWAPGPEAWMYAARIAFSEFAGKASLFPTASDEAEFAGALSAAVTACEGGADPFAWVGR
jgi:transposase